MVYKYTPPTLSGHTVLYKSRRYWIFEIDKDHPYESFEEHYEVIVYDKLECLPAAFCHKDLTGDLNLGTFQDNMTVAGSDYRSLITDIQKKLKLFKHLFS